MTQSQIGLAGLAVMGQNLALNIAEKGFPISVWNRSPAKVDATVARAEEEGKGDYPLQGFHDVAEFVQSIKKPRCVIMLIKAGKPVDATIEVLSAHLEEGDMIIDGGNEWFPNTERRAAAAKERGIEYIGMGVSGGEEGARHGPSMMPGGPREAWDRVAPIFEKVAAQTDSGPCVTYIGPGGAGNYVKMIHNGIEYGDMQLISEAYELLKTLGGLGNEELQAVFEEWNGGELESFLIEITAQIFARKDDQGAGGHVVDHILDKTGMKGTGRWTIQEAAGKSVPVGTIAAALDGRFLSGVKEERIAASKILKGPEETVEVDRAELIKDVANALYASKICSYAQGMNLLRAASGTYDWNLDLGSISRIWKGGCIIRAAFLDRIKQAYDRDANLANLLVDPEFAAELNARQASWRRVVQLAVRAGIAVPGISASLAYFDSYRQARLPANLVQAQRDLFGAHTYQRVDREGVFHTDWVE
ncbi:MAG: NADP-dependent phosphogluconate dehydrogenase [Planctomycetes bacterium]|nr:NADP-dependent phosphogluconate dehydrogenase [Planctomycetota bacterium]